MREGDLGPARGFGPESAVSDRDRPGAEGSGWVIETVVSPFHCLYQDALYFHTQSQLRLARSESEASRLARAALLMYIASAEALVHQAAVELGRPELAALIADPERPLALGEVWRVLPALIGTPGTSVHDTESPPWPQFAELLALRASWAYPGPASARRAYYRSPRKDAAYEPLEPHEAGGLGIAASSLSFPRTGLPRDPYALRPKHLDTARAVLDAAIEALDRRVGGAITRGQRHRKEPVRVLPPPQGRV